MGTRRHTLSKIDLLQYALDGAKLERGLAQDMTDEESDLLDKDIAEIERRIKLVNIADAKKDAS